jgi:hypothetical protein
MTRFGVFAGGRKHAKIPRRNIGCFLVSLRLRLIVSITLGLLASLAFGGALTFWHAAHQVQTEMQAAIAVGEHIARNVVDDSKLSTDRRQRLDRLIAEFDGNRHLQAFLVNRDNQVSRKLAYEF